MTPRPLAAGRRLLARTPLQLKLIVATLALVAVALALIGLASVAALDGYLVGRLDSQLEAVARQPTRPPGEFRRDPDGRGSGPPSPFLIQYRDADGKVVGTVSAPLDEGQPPEVPDDSAWLAANAGEPVTVPAAGGDGRWRVLVHETGLSASGWANDFYSAAAQAASQSWKAFFFGSSDAANFITVDKPPAALWVMGLSARLFGVSSWSLLVPQALMGVATVALVYATVRRWFGPAPGSWPGRSPP